MSLFDQAFDHVVGIEGDFSDDPADSGGATRYGITEALARECGYAGLMRELPFATAKDIYRRHFWDALRLDDVGVFSPKVAQEMFDTGVNCGRGVAAEFLQRSLNVLNRQGRDYPDIEADGEVGDATLAALGAFINRRAPHGERVLYAALNALQGARYIRLAETRQKDEKFVYGWLLNRVA